VASALAATLAPGGKRILLIDADAGRAELTALLSPPEAVRPWWQVPMDEMASAVLAVDGAAGIELLPAAPVNDRQVVVETLHDTLPPVVRWARERADVVVIVGAALGDHAELASALNVVDDILVVTRLRSTPVAAVERLGERLRLRGCSPSGHVLLEHRA
jgi:Mrp family chromosome partitioning ATPase